MSQEELREDAQRLILQSITESKLDFTVLRGKTAELARKYAAAEYNNTGRSGDLAPLNEFYMQQLTHATREVLGIIPEKEWEHGSSNMVSTFVNWASEKVGLKKTPRTLEDYTKEHGLTATRKPAVYDPAKSLAEQGYEFTLSLEKQKEVKGSALNVPAAVLRSVIATANDKESIAGVVINDEEAKSIEKKMQSFIGEYKKAPVILTELAKKDIRDALATLEKADVKSDYPELGNEINELQNILKTQETRKPVLDSSAIKKPSGRH
jgi:hypothetical protein